MTSGDQSTAPAHEPAPEAAQTDGERTPVPAAPAAVDAASFGAVELEVSDLGRAAAFWEETVGLEPSPADDGGFEMRAGSRTLIRLHPGASGPVPDRSTGLFHVAIHLPAEGELARVLGRLAEQRIPGSAVDHLFSEALYISDPDGIGIEFTFETPDRGSARGLEMLGPDGERLTRGMNEPLDTAALMATLPDDDLSRSLPEGTVVGHVHLQVRDLREALAFYRDEVGAHEANVLDGIRFADLHFGGPFRHRIALNTWRSLGAGPRPAGSPGMRSYELRVHDPSARSVVRERLGDHPVDPSGNRIVLVD